MAKLSISVLSISAIAYLWVSSYQTGLFGLTPSALLVALAVYLGMLRFLEGKKIDSGFGKLLIVSLCFLMWAIVVYTVAGMGLPRRVLQIALGIAVAFSVYMITDSYARVEFLVGAMIAGATVSAFVGIGQFFIGEPFVSLWLTFGGTTGIAMQNVLGGRVAGLALDTIMFSYHLVTIIPLAVALWFGMRGRTSEWHRAVLAGAITAMLLALILTMTRSAIAGTFLGSVFSLLLLGSRRRRWMPVLIGALVVSIVLYISVGSFYDPTRFIGMRGVSARVRLPMQLTAIKYAVQHPFGTGTYVLSSGAYVDPSLDPGMREIVLTNTAHNQFLNVLVYYGFPGLGVLLVFYWLLLRRTYALWQLVARSELVDLKWLPAGLVGAVLGYLVNSMFHNAGPFVGDIFNWYIIGLVFASYRILRHAHDRENNRKPSPLCNGEG